MNELCTNPLTCQTEACPLRHYCQQGTQCLLINDEEHVSQFVHLCSEGNSCQLYSDKEHNTRYLHCCKLDSACNLLNDVQHRAKFVHSCQHGLHCSYVQEEQHMTQFVHPCERGVECLGNELAEGIHRDLFSHNHFLLNHSRDSGMHQLYFTHVARHDF